MSSIFDTSEKVDARPQKKAGGGEALESIAWIITMFGALAGVVVLIGGMLTVQSAPQEAVVVALAVACPVIPYCFARAIHHLRHL